MKVNIKTLLPIILFVFVLVFIIGSFTSTKPEQRPQDFRKPSLDEQNIMRIEDVPGVTDVKRFSQNVKNLTSNKTIDRSNTSSSTSGTKVGGSLSYPRILINYVMKRTSLIDNENAGDNKTFIVVNLDIRNYGYQYFDAHPTKFRLAYTAYTNEEFIPIVTVNTGNVLDEVLVNNSRTKGDLVFLLDNKKVSSGVPKIKYIDGSNYTILYNQESQRRRSWSRTRSSY